MTDELEPIEIVTESREEHEVASGDHRRTDLHAWARTACAVVAAAALVWIALSEDAQRAAADQQVCMAEVQSSFFGPRGTPGDDGPAERAEECGLDLLAESLRGFPEN